MSIFSSTTVEILVHFETLRNVQRYCLLLFFAFNAGSFGIKRQNSIFFSSKTQGLQVLANHENFFFFVFGISVTSFFTSLG